MKSVLLLVSVLLSRALHLLTDKQIMARPVSIYRISVKAAASAMVLHKVIKIVGHLLNKGHLQ